MIKKVLLVHGWTGSPEGNWFPWLKQKLEAQNLEVIAPQLPDPDHPKREAWVGHLESLDLGNTDELIVVGHSLGCAATLHFVEKFKPNQKLAAAIMVAGFAEPLSIPEISDLVTGSWNDEKIKESIDKIIYYASDNDPYVPTDKGENMQQHFGGELIIVHDASHFNEEAGCLELPIVYDKIMEIVKS